MSDTTAAAAKNRPARYQRSVSRTLRTIRRERKVSQAQTVHKLRELGIDMHSTTLSRMERGKLSIRMDELVALCEVYRVNVGYVLLGAELGVVLSETGSR